MNPNGSGYRPVERIPSAEPVKYGGGNEREGNENAPPRAILARDGTGLLGFSMPRPHNDDTLVTRTGGGESVPADQATSCRRRSVLVGKGCRPSLWWFEVARSARVRRVRMKPGSVVASVGSGMPRGGVENAPRGRINFASADDHSGCPGRSDSSVRWAVTYREIRRSQRKSWDRRVSPCGCHNWFIRNGLRNAIWRTHDSSSRKIGHFTRPSMSAFPRLTCCPNKE